MPQYNLIDAPTPAPRKFGLFSVADVGSASGTDFQGIEYYNDNCLLATTVTADAICVGQVARSVTGDNHGTTTALAFQTYVYVECAGVNEFKGLKDRAIGILNNGFERAVESRLNAVLKADAAAVNLTPGTIPTPTRGLAILEQWADTNYAGAPTLGGSRELISVMSSTDGLDIHGNHLESSLGSPAFGGANLVSGPLDAAVGAGNAWLWALGKVIVRYDQMQVTDPVFIQSASVNEVQTITITGTPTGGTYTLTFDGQTTTAITYNSNAATVTAALVALSNVDSGDITVTGTYPNFTATFGGQYGQENVPQITATPSLTGGTAPSVAIATTTGGVNNFGDNSYRVMAVRNVLLSYDCLAAATKVVLPA